MTQEISTLMQQALLWRTEGQSKVRWLNQKRKCQKSCRWILEYVGKYLQRSSSLTHSVQPLLVGSWFYKSQTQTAWFASLGLLDFYYHFIIFVLVSNFINPVNTNLHNTNNLINLSHNDPTKDAASDVDNRQARTKSFKTSFKNGFGGASHI